MTVVLSYVSTQGSIILSDNRINYGRNQEGGFQDGVTKLIDLPQMGWASGAGLSDYLIDVKKKLASANIVEVDDIKSVFKEVTAEHINDNVGFKDDISESVLVTSWFGANEDRTETFFRVGILSEKHFGSNIGLLNKGEIDIVYPGDYLNDMNKVNTVKEKFNLNVGEDINSALKTMLEIFDDISKGSKQVSRTCDIGMQLLTSQAMFKLKFSNHIEKLIQDYENGTFQSKAEVIGALELEL